MSQEKKPSAFHRFMMNFTSVLGLPAYKNLRARQLGKVPPPACFNDERLGDSPSGSPSTVRRSYSLGSKDRDRNKKRAKRPRQWRRKRKLEWESNCGHRVILGDVSLDELCEAERRALQEVALIKLNRMDFNIPSNLVKVLSQLSTARNKVQRRKKLAADRDQNYVFGQPLERAVFLDTTQSSWRLSPLNLNAVPHLNSTPVTTKPHEKGSLHSVSSASVVSDTPSDTPMPSVSSPAYLHGNNTTSFQFKSFSSSRLDGGASALGSPLLVTHDHHFSLNMDAEEPPLQLLRDGSSLHSLDVSAVQLEEPAPLSPHSERKALLSTSPPMVPAVVQNSIDYLHSKGITTEGIFRISGSKARISQLRERFDRGENVELKGDVNPHDVACLLKEYLRSLPEPLIIRELYSYFIMTRRIQSRSQRRDTLCLLCLLLPRPNRDTLKCLLHFLNQVAMYSNDIILMDGTEEQGNRMSEENLGKIVGPNILHKRKVQSEYSSLSKGETEDVGLVGQVVEDLITMEGTIFKVTGELLDEAMERMLLTDPHSADCLFRMRCEVPGLEDDEDDSLSLQAPADVRASCDELTGVGATYDQLTVENVPMIRSKSSEVLRLKATDSLPLLTEAKTSRVATSVSPIAANSSSLRDTSKQTSLEPSEVVLLVPHISLRQEEEGEQQEMSQTGNNQQSLQREGLPQDSHAAQSHADGPDAGCLAELGEESPVSLLQHDRMSSESSSGSNPVLPFPGACKNEGSDSGFSFTNLSLNTGSRSSWEGLAPATEVVDGGNSSVASPTHSQDGSRPSESPRPTTDGLPVPPVKKDTRKDLKDKADTTDISVGFQELQSALAGLDTHISQWSATEKAPPSLPTTVQHWTSTQEEQFADLDSHLEQLTSELTRLDSISQPPLDGGSDRGSFSRPSSSSTSHDRRHSGEESQDHLDGGSPRPPQSPSAFQSPSHGESSAKHKSKSGPAESSGLSGALANGSGHQLEKRSLHHGLEGFV